MACRSTAQVHNDVDSHDEEHQSTSTTADEEKPPSWNKKHLVISAIPFLVAVVCLGIVVWLVLKGDSREPTQPQPPDDIESSDASCLCSCSPTVFAFMLNFSTSCPGNLVDHEGNLVNDAIGDQGCFTTVVGGDSRNSQPIHVETVTIQELNMERDIPVKSTTLRGPFEDGDMLTYEYISLYANLTTVYYFPFVLQMTSSSETSSPTISGGGEQTPSPTIMPHFKARRYPQHTRQSIPSQPLAYVLVPWRYTTLH